MRQSVIKYLPNSLTFLRLVLIPFFVIMMIDPSPTMRLVAFFTYAVASITDVIDGRVARHYRVVSNVGKLLDPIADKILVMSALVMILAYVTDSEGQAILPGWLVVLVLARETWVNGVRSVAALRGVVVAASKLGKLKSFMQMSAIGLLLMPLSWRFEFSGYYVPFASFGVPLLMLSVVISYWGALEYTFAVFGQKTDPVAEEEGNNEEK